MKNLIQICFVIGCFVLVSCTNDFEDINTNPNSPEVAPSAPILTYVQRVMSGSWIGDVWYNMNESSSMAGQMTKISYIDEARYGYRSGTVNSMFNNPYVYIRNLNRILLNEEGPDGNPNMTAVALILKCYLYQILTDHLGAIPYSEAFQGENGNYTPKYDSQESIYRDMLNVLKTASDMINVTPPATQVITGADIIYGGNVTRWKKFANSLRLRMAVRMSYVDEAGAKAVISEILGNPSAYPLLESNADNARFKWPGDANYREPLSSAGLTRVDYISCSTIVNVLKELDDPRLPVYAQLTQDKVDDATATIYRGFVAGAPGPYGNLSIFSKIGSFFSENVAGYTYHFRYAEVEFLKAEIYARNLYTGDAEAAYNAGITASISEYTAVTVGPVTTVAQIAPYLALPKVAYTNPELPRLTYAGNDYYDEEIKSGAYAATAISAICYIPNEILLNECANATVKANPQLQKIAYQKWLCLYQQGQEAWAEVRRTDIPVISAAPGRPQGWAAHNRCPTRFPYPNDEKNLNEANLAAVSNGIVDMYWGQQMWWDKRVGVK